MCAHASPVFRNKKEACGWALPPPCQPAHGGEPQRQEPFPAPGRRASAGVGQRATRRGSCLTEAFLEPLVLGELPVAVLVLGDRAPLLKFFPCFRRQLHVQVASLEQRLGGAGNHGERGGGAGRWVGQRNPHAAAGTSKRWPCQRRRAHANQKGKERERGGAREGRPGHSGQPDSKGNAGVRTVASYLKREPLPLILACCCGLGSMKSSCRARPRRVRYGLWWLSLSMLCG